MGARWGRKSKDRTPKTTSVPREGPMCRSHPIKPKTAAGCRSAFACFCGLHYCLIGMCRWRVKEIRMQPQAICCAISVLVLAMTTAVGQITTSQYDNLRTGATLNETILTLQNVNVRQFGKLGAFK